MSTWPQWTFLILMLIGVGVTLARFGQQKRDYHDMGDILSAALTLWLLWMGGFFTPIGW